MNNKHEEPIRFSHDSNSNSNSIHTIHTIHTYIHQLEEERGVQHSVYCSPELWQAFKDAVSPQPVSVVLRQFMVDQVEQKLLAQNDPQVHITNYFIEPQQVNVAQNQVIVTPQPKPRRNYQDVPLEELQRLYDRSDGPNHYRQRMAIAIELRRRELLRTSGGT